MVGVSDLCPGTGPAGDYIRFHCHRDLHRHGSGFAGGVLCAGSHLCAEAHEPERLIPMSGEYGSPYCFRYLYCGDGLCHGMGGVGAPDPAEAGGILPGIHYRADPVPFVCQHSFADCGMPAGRRSGRAFIGSDSLSGGSRLWD